MEITASITDITLSAITTIGLVQIVWFSVMLLRRGIGPATIQLALPPLLAIWVLMWPVYTDRTWVWLGIFLLGLPVILASILHAPFWQQLKQAWSTPPKSRGRLIKAEHVPMWPMTHLLTALAIAAAFFQTFPEFGFGTGLSICLALPAACWLDHTGHFALGFPAHPGQTLAGHLILILMTAIVCGWSLHIYHGIGWQQIFIATLLTGIAASLARALVPGGWNQPAMALAMGGTLWLL
ncbi:MAG: hypothetical protein ACE5F3_02030 [Mariprofundaceae bacterium]